MVKPLQWYDAADHLARGCQLFGTVLALYMMCYCCFRFFCFLLMNILEKSFIMCVFVSCGLRYMISLSKELEGGHLLDKNFLISNEWPATMRHAYNAFFSFIFYLFIYFSITVNFYAYDASSPGVHFRDKRDLMTGIFCGSFTSTIHLGRLMESQIL